MTTNGQELARGTFGENGTSDSHNPQYTVIVHPAGQIDDAGAARFWTEVPAFTACSSDGPTLQHAVDNTRREISRWLNYVQSQAANIPTPANFELIVERAF